MPFASIRPRMGRRWRVWTGRRKYTNKNKYLFAEPMREKSIAGGLPQKWVKEMCAAGGTNGTCARFWRSSPG
jgi:hypothetical protein